MNAAIADVVLPIDENLDSGAFVDLARAIRHDRGVVAVRHRSDRSRLMVVVYDPAVTRAVEVLPSVRQGGLHAQLIGM